MCGPASLPEAQASFSEAVPLSQRGGVSLKGRASLSEEWPLYERPGHWTLCEAQYYFWEAQDPFWEGLACHLNTSEVEKLNEEPIKIHESDKYGPKRGVNQQKMSVGSR